LTALLNHRAEATSVVEEVAQQLSIRWLRRLRSNRWFLRRAVRPVSKGSKPPAPDQPPTYADNSPPVCGLLDHDTAG
jgi:hypothetical protein